MSRSSIVFGSALLASACAAPVVQGGAVGTPGSTDTAAPPTVAPTATAPLVYQPDLYIANAAGIPNGVSIYPLGDTDGDGHVEVLASAVSVVDPLTTVSVLVELDRFDGSTVEVRSDVNYVSPYATRTPATDVTGDGSVDFWSYITSPESGTLQAAEDPGGPPIASVGPAGCVGSADFTGDGIPDHFCGGNAPEGGLTLLPGPLAGEYSLPDAALFSLWQDEIPFSQLVPLGDVDGDGLGDLLAYDSWGGDGAVWSGGKARGTPEVSYFDESSVLPGLIGILRMDDASRAAFAPGDVDGDGLAEIGIGNTVYRYDGAALVPLVVLGDSIAYPSSIDDRSGDGRSDILLVAYLGKKGEGMVRIVDPAAGFTVVKEMALTDITGVRVADLDGDAVDDIAVFFIRSPTQIFLSTSF